MESWCAFYRRRWAIDVRVARPGAVVGPGREASGAASNFTTAIIQEPLAGASVRPARSPRMTPRHSSTNRTLSTTGEAIPRAERYFTRLQPRRLLGDCPRAGGAGSASESPARRSSSRPDDVARFVVGRWKHVVQNNRLSRARDFGYAPKYDTPAKLVDAFPRGESARLSPISGRGTGGEGVVWDRRARETPSS
jgi:hypothetical protein